MCKSLTAGILLVALGTVGIGAAPPSIDAAGRNGLEILPLLHDARFDAAERRLARIADGDLARQAFLEAFVTYWRLLYDPDNAELLDRLGGQLDRAVEVSDPGDSEASALWGGSARLLRAQMYAARRKPFKAGYEAKRAKALLEEAAGGDHRAEAYFGLGTFNYYASQLPAIVKGLRFLLALPRGNRERGLEQLATASRESRLFGFEARVLLVTIYAGKHERDFVSALREAEIALASFPPSVGLSYSAALLDVAIGRPRSGIERLEDALEQIAAQPDTDPAFVARVHYQIARAELSRFRPDRALEAVRPLLEGPLEVPGSLAVDLDKLANRAVYWNGRPPWLSSWEPSFDKSSGPPTTRDTLRRTLPALERERRGDVHGASVELTALAAEAPDDAGLALLAGRALLLDRRYERALELLERAAVSKELPKQWAGPCRLLAGQAADAAGQRELALRYYREAIASRPFVGRDAAYLHSATPFGSVPGADG